MTNNDILKKLRVALQLRNDQIADIVKLTGLNVSPTELSAFFRTEDHRNYRPCGDQFLRAFLDGLIIHLRGDRTATEPATAETVATKAVAPGEGAARAEAARGEVKREEGRADSARPAKEGSRGR